MYTMHTEFTLAVPLSLGVAPRVKSLAGLSDGSLPGLERKSGYSKLLK